MNNKELLEKIYRFLIVSFERDPPPHIIAGWCNGTELTELLKEISDAKDK